MSTNWEKKLKQLNSTNGMFTPELKQKIINRIQRKERITTTFYYIRMISALYAICLVAALFSQDIVKQIQQLASSISSVSKPERIDELEILPSIKKDIPIYPGLKKKPGKVNTYYIENVSLVAVMSYYDSEMQKRQWIDHMPGYETNAITKFWSYDTHLIAVKFYKDEHNASTIEFNILPKKEKDLAN